MSSMLKVCVLMGMIHFSLWAEGQTYPSGFSQATVATGISNPTVMAFAPDGRVFVAQQGGQLRVIKDDVLLPNPFVALTVNSSGERGLIGIALDPDFTNNHFIYLYYTVPAPLHNRISRFTAAGDVALAGSEVTVLDLDPLSATNHNGGALAFGPDGKLYVAIGDNATGSNSQSLDTYHGKILRINSDGSVPAGNPFVGGSAQRQRVWAYGLRNPYTMGFQPATGKLFVNDVGQSSWEEINDATAGGLNFGWPAAEGFSANPSFTNPVYAYGRGSADGVGCAITGGSFFNPSATNYPGSYYGKYFFLDYCSRWINFIDPDQVPAVRAPFATNISGAPVEIKVGTDGNLYYLSRSLGALVRITYNNTTTPFITTHPGNQSIMEGLTAEFSVNAVGSQPFTYQWQKDNQDINGAINQTLSILNVDTPDQGEYRVTVTNAAGSATSNAATLSVIPVNDFPIAEILTPVDSSNYSAGTTVTFSGTANDIEDGPLPPGAYAWRIHFHHDMHVHDQPDITGITNGTFDIPNQGETSDNVWYRIFLIVSDSEGLQDVDSVDLFPRKTTLSLTTNPPGLQLTLDDQPFDTPGSVVSVEGMLRSIAVVSPQVLAEVEYEFESWSHGGDASQTITTPVDDVTYTANFSIVVGSEAPNSNPDFEIYPNPVSTQAEAVIRIQVNSQESFTVRLIDAIVKTTNSFSVSLTAGENLIPLPVGDLHPGMHVIRLETSQRNWSAKLLVK
jgi:glucose/arabinose dehydrogenase